MATWAKKHHVGGERVRGCHHLMRVGSSRVRERKGSEGDWWLSVAECSAPLSQRQDGRGLFGAPWAPFDDPKIIVAAAVGAAAV